MSDHRMKRATLLSPPDYTLLDNWGAQLHATFGAFPYLVGSVLREDGYRDVDVRLPLEDLDPLLAAPRLRVLNMALSLWGRQVTGLPIDFQFQSLTEFRGEKGPCNPFGVRAVSEYA